ncbi:hypothetical protein C8R31_11030 [Nitrosospira sp. Nsp2]|nr:hypothetical protein C8R31_11030 [Nitrosospira sp. Nsp2]
MFALIFVVRLRGGTIQLRGMRGRLGGIMSGDRDACMQDAHEAQQYNLGKYPDTRCRFSQNNPFCSSYGLRIGAINLSLRKKSTAGTSGGDIFVHVPVWTRRGRSKQNSSERAKKILLIWRGVPA